MKRDIAYYGHSALRKKASEIHSFDEETDALIQDLLDTIKAHAAWGLAAPQIGVSKRVFVTSIPDIVDDEEKHPPRYRVWVNPKIIEYSDENWLHGESCVSIPGIYEEVERPYKIRIRALDREGAPFEEEATGWHARLYCHENDHLNGVLTIDRIDKKRRKLIEEQLRKIKKKYSS